MKFETDAKVAEKIKNIGDKVVADIFGGNAPEVSLPVRAASNVHYNKEEGLLYLGNSKSSRNFL
ncbi:MAG: hypothetical protein KAI51_00705, partial [Candidatus Aenigmarchaeota archaeon]|nr:hypothetical protein [Candidatus Aenigmarchaeota archaeon]